MQKTPHSLLSSRGDNSVSLYRVAATFSFSSQMSQSLVPCKLSPQGSTPSVPCIAWHGGAASPASWCKPREAAGTLSSLQPAKDRQQEQSKTEREYYIEHINWAIHYVPRSKGREKSPALIVTGGTESTAEIHAIAQHSLRGVRAEVFLLHLPLLQWCNHFNATLTASGLWACLWHSISIATMLIFCLPAAPFYKRSDTSWLSSLLSTIQPFLLFTAFTFISCTLLSC